MMKREAKTKPGLSTRANTLLNVPKFGYSDKVYNGRSQTRTITVAIRAALCSHCYEN